VTKSLWLKTLFVYLTQLCDKITIVVDFLFTFNVFVTKSRLLMTLFVYLSHLCDIITIVEDFWFTYNIFVTKSLLLKTFGLPITSLWQNNTVVEDSFCLPLPYLWQKHNGWRLFLFTFNIFVTKAQWLNTLYLPLTSLLFLQTLQLPCPHHPDCFCISSRSYSNSVSVSGSNVCTFTLYNVHWVSNSIWASNCMGFFKIQYAK
jgi:hypothetical protein